MDVRCEKYNSRGVEPSQERSVSPSGATSCSLSSLVPGSFSRDFSTSPYKGYRYFGMGSVRRYRYLYWKLEFVRSKMSRRLSVGVDTPWVLIWLLSHKRKPPVVVSIPQTQNHRRFRTKNRWLWTPESAIRRLSRP
jgi:hypothetical protein